LKNEIKGQEEKSTYSGMLILIIINIRETVYYVMSLVSFNYVRLDSHGFQQLSCPFILQQPTCKEWTSKEV